ncbi:MAG: hypothetical protein ACOCJN_08850 [Spirochaetaceae bacterium JB067]
MEFLCLRKYCLLFSFGLILLIPLSANEGEEFITMYEGMGDDFISIEKAIPDYPALMLVYGNSDERHFAITSYDETNEYLDLLVNTTDRYLGTVPLDLGSAGNTAFLEINATGAWQLIIYPIFAAERLEKNIDYYDTGDNVLWIEEEGSLLEIAGNGGERHFSVIAYDSFGNYSDLLVNTTDVYAGRVRLPSDTLILQVSAVGDWTMTLR